MEKETKDRIRKKIIEEQIMRQCNNKESLLDLISKYLLVRALSPGLLYLMNL